ncbi:ABC transporter substrate-binding protein [Streptomyces sp. NPDC091279]|uniref:ABC transporter substrate-binding protein n=1 Tax=Streptomyces sp. NPDC091279 TaxID=3365983 RepID=UPI0037FE82E5
MTSPTLLRPDCLRAALPHPGLPRLALPRPSEVRGGGRVGPSRWQPSRRGLLAGGGALAATAGLAACGSGGSAAAGGASGSGAWSFTDDRGKTVRLAKRPRRIAVLTDTVGAALWAAGLRPVAATDSGQGIVTAVGLTWDGVAKIYSADQGVELEALAQARPDLLIDALQPDGTLQVSSRLAAIGKIAPVVGLSMYRPIEEIARTADRLTRSIGTDLTDTAAKAGYERASGALKKAVAANPDLRVGFVFDIDKNTVGVMNAKTWGVLRTVDALGMRLVQVPGGSAHTYSQAVSWENVPSIPADLLVWAVASPLPTNPLWKRTPAVRAGQVWQPKLASWYAYSWANFSVLLDGLATHVHAARPGVGPRA